MGDPNRLCFASREQVDEFCRVHHDKLRKGGYATFFLYKEREEFFVALVGVYGDGRLRVGVGRFSCGVVWNAESRYRFVIPQQTPSS